MKLFIPMFFSLMFIQTDAQQQLPSNDEIKAFLKLAFTIENALTARNGDVKLSEDYLLDSKGCIIGQRYIHGTHSSEPIITNEGTMELVTSGTTILWAKQVMACNAFTVDMQDQYTYDEHQNLTTMESKTWYERGKGYFKKIVRIEYQNGKMSKVVENELSGEGKSRSNVTPIGEDFKDITTLVWKNDHEVTFTTTNYYRREKKKDPQKVNFTRTYEVSIEKDHYSRRTGNLKNLDVEEFQLSGKEAILVRADSVNKTKVIRVSTIDDSGKVVKEVNSEYKADKLDQKAESTIKSELKDPKADLALPCSYKQTRFTSIYNANDVLIREQNENGIRVRNPDGTWSPWKGFTY